MLKPIVGLSLLFVIVFGVDYLMSKLLPFAEPLHFDLSSNDTKQIEIYVEMTNQLLTLATLVFAGAGLSFKEKREKSNLTPRGQHLLLGTMLLGAFSIYIGYLSYDKMVWMLSQQFFNLNTPILYWARALQFWSFISSIVLFAWLWMTE